MGHIPEKVWKSHCFATKLALYLVWFRSYVPDTELVYSHHDLGQWLLCLFRDILENDHYDTYLKNAGSKFCLANVFTPQWSKCHTFNFLHVVKGLDTSICTVDGGADLDSLYSPASILNMQAITLVNSMKMIRKTLPISAADLNSEWIWNQVQVSANKKETPIAKLVSQLQPSSFQQINFIKLYLQLL